MPIILLGMRLPPSRRLQEGLPLAVKEGKPLHLHLNGAISTPNNVTLPVSFSFFLLKISAAARTYQEAFNVFVSLSKTIKGCTGCYRGPKPRDLGLQMSQLLLHRDEDLRIGSLASALPLLLSPSPATISSPRATTGLGFLPMPIASPLATKICRPSQTALPRSGPELPELPQAVEMGRKPNPLIPEFFSRGAFGLSAELGDVVSTPAPILVASH
ncbi:uncharacterized protein BDZ99DRAFT_514167 [Mytilinidion resinicola]|uniref:Uncharacterized protein n=1 Tax=Mytilinidion resinicola TaxID=574789 RepID=A0A6A6ZCM2_9PEZI|nr:uncharacterized protein BDZ99DRAFT_514167 [Mytilinidion resinicola]KAF2817947.1 hypothetical protein BDZ99DRAFT_514167 [Mytilinidion resinicola]